MFSSTRDHYHHQTCYFTFTPNPSDHFSTETPFCSPGFSPDEISTPIPDHPLLAVRGYNTSNNLTAPSSPIMASNLLQLQTNAAHRPQPRPTQNVLHVTSDDSSSSSSSSSSLPGSSTVPQIVRCSRCQRTPSLDIKTGKSNMVQIGMNSYYCNRCAQIVGFSPR